jgi:hypothetical protein
VKILVDLRRNRYEKRLVVVVTNTKKYLVSLWGKTMNSYLQNHDFLGMLPSPHEAEKRGLAPPDIFPHKSSIKIPVRNDGVPHHNWTSDPKNHQDRYHEFIAPYFLLPCSPRWATQQNGHRNPKRGHIQYICAVVIAAGALHRRYDHHIRLRSDATFRRRVMME